MKRPRGPPPGIPPRDGAAPYVAAFAWGALEELPLRCLIVGHNPSTHAFASGFAYSNPTNRLLALVNGTFSGGPPYEGLLPAWADFPYQDWAPLHRGVGFSDLGVEPGNDAAAYDHATLLRWRDELFASVAGHMRRVGAGLQTLAAVAATAAGDGGSGGGGASSSSAAARPSPSSTAAMSGGSGNKRRRAITAADEVTSSYFSATAASVTATATASSSSSAAASSSSSAAAAVTVSSSVTSSAAAAPFVCTALDGVPPPVARAVLAAVARRAGLASWRQLSAAQLASPAVTAPRYIAFAGKAEWKFLFDPPLSTCEFGVQPAGLRPPGWPCPVGPGGTDVFVLPSSSGRAALTNEARRTPYVALAALVNALPWLDAATVDALEVEPARRGGGGARRGAHGGGISAQR